MEKRGTALQGIDSETQRWDMTVEPAAEPQNRAFDLALAAREWERVLPAAVREDILAQGHRERLLTRVDQFIRLRSPESLGELGGEAYHLCSRLEPLVGREAALRFVRDGLSRVLTGLRQGDAPYAEAAEQILLRVTDAAWQAHTDKLQETISIQQQEHFQHELTLAKRIQERLLPRSIPQVRGFDIAGRVLPAAEVGGDYWSCKEYPEDDIVTLKLADVTGHGIAAATLVAAVKFISGGYFRGSKTAAQVMERTNTVLVRETPHEIMVTMFYGWLYPESSEMTVVNAGHSPLLHYSRGRFCHIPPTGLALGMMETRYREVRLTLDPGDIFITCSDGVTEPSAEIALGVEWIEKQVAALAAEPARVIVDRIIENALSVYGTPKDDMSVLVVKREPRGS